MKLKDETKSVKETNWGWGGSVNRLNPGHFYRKITDEKEKY